jgi:phytanoyl-CoA hydroxylase
MPFKLTENQMQHFDREGYLVAEDIFTDTDLAPVIAEVTAVIDQKCVELIAAGELSRDYREFPFETRLTHISRETDKIAMSIWNGVLNGPAVFNLIRTPKLLDIAEQMCGPELIASSVYRLRPKISNHVMGPVPWHQDSGYFEPYCDNSLVLTVWLPLVDATAENGCMWVVPRAHKGNVLLHGSRAGKPYLAIPERVLPQEPESRPVCTPVKKGGALLLTNLTPHASFDNTTETVRYAMDLRYQSAKLPTNAKMTRLPGDSLANEAEGIPGACYPPEADFLVRSRLRPTEVVTDPAEFARLRTSHVPGPISRKWGMIEV